MISLRKRQGSGQYVHNCAGSLVTAGYIVTAAHCLHRTTKEMWQVVAGEHAPGHQDSGEQVIRVSYVIMLPLSLVLNFTRFY